MEGAHVFRSSCNACQTTMLANIRQFRGTLGDSGKGHSSYLLTDLTGQEKAGK